MLRLQLQKNESRALGLSRSKWGKKNSVTGGRGPRNLFDNSAVLRKIVVGFVSLATSW